MFVSICMIKFGCVNLSQRIYLYTCMYFLLANDAVSILHQRGICQQTDAPLQLVASDILDHYRTYALLEKLLHTPTKLVSEQLAFQIEPQTSQMLIEM